VKKRTGHKERNTEGKTPSEQSEASLKGRKKVKKGGGGQHGKRRGQFGSLYLVKKKKKK